MQVSVLARRTASPGGKAPVLLLHGLIAEGETFRSLVEHLPDDRDYYAVDMPGAGYSERPTKADVGFGGLALVLLELMRSLGLERPIVLGHSHGGAVALRCAASYPDELGGLVLMCPAHPFSGHEDWLVWFYRTPVGRLFAHSLPRIPNWLLFLGFQRMPGSRSSLTLEEFAPYLHTLHEPGTVQHLLRLLNSWQADMDHLRADLETRKVTTEALLIWGKRDIVVPVKTAESLMARFDRARLVVLEGVGHLPNEEAPVECAAAIIAWMDGLSTEGAAGSSSVAFTRQP